MEIHLDHLVFHTFLSFWIRPCELPQTVLTIELISYW